jgi:hypothetical protein
MCLRMKGVSRDVFREDRVPAGAQGGQGGVQVGRVPQRDAVQEQAERAELIFHPLVVLLPQLARLAVEDVPPQVVPGFLQVAHGLDVAAVVGVVDEGQHVPGLEDPAVGGDRVAQRGGVAVAGDRPQHVVGAHRAGVDGGGDPQDVGPVAADRLQVDPAAGGIQRPVVGLRVDPPQLLVGQVGELGPVGEPPGASSPKTMSVFMWTQSRVKGSPSLKKAGSVELMPVGSVWSSGSWGASGSVGDQAPSRLSGAVSTSSTGDPDP